MQFGVIVFPGSNCDHDAYHVVKKVLDCSVNFIWHKETNLDYYDCLIGGYPTITSFIHAFIFFILLSGEG